MSDPSAAAVRDPMFGDVALNWKWMLALGLLMVALGVIGLGMTYLLTIITMIWFGALALVGGVAQLIEAVRCSGWKAVVSHVLMGLLYLAAGIVLIVMPIQSAWWLTLLVGALFIVSGVLRIVMAFQMSGAGSAPLWLGISGGISVVLGVMIFGIVEFPTQEALATAESAQGWFAQWGWVIGLFVAIEFLVHGAALSALAMAARTVGKGAGEGEEGSPPPAAA